MGASLPAAMLVVCVGRRWAAGAACGLQLAVKAVRLPDAAPDQTGMQVGKHNVRRSFFRRVAGGRLALVRIAVPKRVRTRDRCSCHTWRRTKLGRAAKVHERPRIAPGPPQDIGRLEVPMAPPRGVQLRQALCHVQQHKDGCGGVGSGAGHPLVQALASLGSAPAHMFPSVAAHSFREQLQQVHCVPFVVGSKRSEHDRPDIFLAVNRTLDVTAAHYRHVTCQRHCHTNAHEVATKATCKVEEAACTAQNAHGKWRKGKVEGTHKVATFVGAGLHDRQHCLSQLRVIVHGHLPRVCVAVVEELHRTHGVAQELRSTCAFVDRCCMQMRVVQAHPAAGRLRAALGTALHS